MKILLPTIILLCNLLFATEQEPDILYYNGKKIFIYSYPLESRVKNDSKLVKKLDKLECMSTACWRRVIGNYKIENDSLFLIGLQEPCEKQSLNLENYFDKTEIKNGKIFVNWFSDQIIEGFGKYLGFSLSEYKGIYENQIDIELQKGLVKNIFIKEQGKNKILGSWGNDELGNALFAFYPDSIYYPNENLRYKYSMKSDTIIIKLEDKLIEKVQILEITDKSLKLNYLNYDKVQIVNKRE